jgi:hypothetical protein
MSTTSDYSLRSENPHSSSLTAWEKHDREHIRKPAADWRTWRAEPARIRFGGYAIVSASSDWMHAKLQPTVYTHAFKSLEGSIQACVYTCQVDDDAEPSELAIKIVREMSADVIGIWGDDRGGKRLHDLARALIGAFGRHRPVQWYRPFVELWYERSSRHMHDDDTVQFEEVWSTYIRKHERVHSGKGEVIALAVSAAKGLSMSLGLPDETMDRAARLFRWLSRYHHGGEFWLDYRRIQGSIGVASPRTAQKVTKRLEGAGLLKNVCPGSRTESTTWRWLGPE